jgi:biopolymer transport protein ExbD
MSRLVSTEMRAEPNLTPMLDMVFQLITFFMLVINFKSAEIDLTLKLPVVGSARPVDTQGQRELLVLNIDRYGDLKIYGRSVTNIESYIRNEAQVRGNLDADEELATTIVIRADRATPFKMLNRVIKACQENGFRKFALKAIDRET